MLAGLDLDQLADALHAAQERRDTIEPLTAEHPELSVADAYWIQQLNVRRRLDAGRELRGYKIGLTSKAMQEQFGVDEPDYGTLLDDMFVADGGRVPTRQLLQPLVEAEIAFELRADLEGPGLSGRDVLAATRAIRPSLEVIDSRIAGWRCRLPDTIADNASGALVVLGPASAPRDERALALLGMLLEHNGATVATAAGAAVQGGPANCVAWLANTLAAYGTTIKAGQVVLSGALHRAVPVAPGDVFRASFAHLGRVEVSFAGDRP